MDYRLPSIITGFEDVDDALEKWRQAIESSLNIQFFAPLEEKFNGFVRTVRVKKSPRIIARITGGNGAGRYSWVEVYGAPGSYQTVPGGHSGTLTANSAWELIEAPAVAPGAYVWLEYDSSADRWIFAAPNGLIPAQAQSGIGAGNMSSATAGSVKLCVPGTGASFVAGSVSVTAYNHYTTPVPTNAFVWLTPVDGYLHVVSHNCSASA